MLQLDDEYFAMRLEQELVAAQDAATPGVAAIHMELALEYQARIPDIGRHDTRAGTPG